MSASASPGGLVQPLAVSRVDPVVGIHEKDEFARRGVESPVAGAAQAAVLLRNDPDAVVLRRIAVQDVDRPVGTSVVDADDLDPAQGLSHHAVQASGQKRLDIVDRNDNADFRFHRLSNIIFYRLGDSFAVERRRNDAAGVTGPLSCGKQTLRFGMHQRPGVARARARASRCATPRPRPPLRWSGTRASGGRRSRCPDAVPAR